MGSRIEKERGDANRERSAGVSPAALRPETANHAKYANTFEPPIDADAG
jgi:hypothetical protein